MEFDLLAHRAQIRNLAEQGIYLGASSWKYPGWRGLIYDEQRYLSRSKFSQALFERHCLEEYAQTYATVCVDAGYYRFPTEDYLQGLAAQVPEGFRFGFKVTDEITLKRFPSLPRFGTRAGQPNPHFLSPECFLECFLEPCKTIRPKIGPLIFEFSSFHKGEYEHGRDFVADLDRFLSSLERGWEYGVEIRNRQWLAPEYFQVLESHGVAHVYNNWTRMPPVAEQLDLQPSSQCPFSVARFLLKPGRSYAQAVAAFEPYNQAQEVDKSARTAACRLLELAQNRRVYLYVNNRLEGCAPLTIEAILNHSSAKNTPGA